MRFAKLVFLGAGMWGLLVVIPPFFMFDYVGRQYPPALTHPEFYFGFLTVTLAWQIAFLVMSRDPQRFRPLMIPAMIEKFTYIAAMATLYEQGRVQLPLMVGAIPDLLLGILFVAAFIKTH